MGTFSQFFILAKESLNIAYFILKYFQLAIVQANVVPWQFYATDSKTRMFQCPALALNLRFLIARASCIREIQETTEFVVLTKGLPRNAKEEILVSNIIYYNTGNQNKQANFAILETVYDTDLFDKKKRPICIASAVSSNLFEL